MLAEGAPAASTLNEVDRLSRKRLKAEQIEQLEQEYQRDPNWHSSFITALAKRLQLNRTKIYKWSWDRKKKDAAMQTGNSATTTADSRGAAPSR